MKTLTQRKNKNKKSKRPELQLWFQPGIFVDGVKGILVDFGGKDAYIPLLSSIYPIQVVYNLNTSKTHAGNYP